MLIGKVTKGLAIAAALSAAGWTHALAQEGTLKFGLCLEAGCGA